MKKLVSMLGMLALLILPASTAAHGGPIQANCGSYTFKVVVFEHDFNGLSDVFCASLPSWGPSWLGDPHFSQNNTAGNHDIGQYNLMNDRVSSVSMSNISARPYCVSFFWDANYGGVSYTERLDPNEHDHLYPNAFDNDSWSSVRVRNDGNCVSNH
jgi:hypothetical protein